MTTATRTTRRWPAGVLLPVVVLGAVLVLAAFVPIPGADIAAAALSGAWAWWIVVALALAAAAVVLVVRGRTTARIAAAVLSILSVLGVGVVGGAQAVFAAQHGVAVDVGALLTQQDGVRDPDHDVVYTEGPGGEPVELSVYEPAQADGAAPVVLWIHGGGWISGSRTDDSPAIQSSWLADNGYLVVSVDYTLATDDDPRWDSTESQIACALAWTEEHAAEYGGDTARFAVSGDSAGGHLALQAAYRAAAGTLDSSCGGSLPDVDAVSVLYPVASPQGFYENPDVVLGPLARNMASTYTGGSPDEHPERYAAITPANHLGAATPPTLMAVGAHDHLVPPSGARELAEALDANGTAHTLIEAPFAEHVFDLLPGSVATQVWRAETLRWFAAHGVASSGD